MDLSQPPQDEETKNIIDRLANFVARNGVEFEEMTKEKQRGNPRFQFLFGGEYYNYYTCRVATEQAIIKHQEMRKQHMLSQRGGPPPVPLIPHQSSAPVDRESFQPGLNQGLPRFNQPNFERPGHFDNNFNPNFDRDRQGYDRGQGPGFQNFDRAPGPAVPHDGPSLNYDKGPQHFERRASNFERDEGTNYDKQQYPPQQYDRESGGGPGPRNFMPGPRFERPQGPGPGSARFGGPRPQGRFERPPGPPGVMNFERHPAPLFDRQTGPPGVPYQGDRLAVTQHANQAANPGFERHNPNPVGPGSATFSPGDSSAPPHPIAAAVNSSALQSQIDALLPQKVLLEEQIRQSEKNLLAQHQVLLTQQQAQIEEALMQSQDIEIKTLANELGIIIEDFDTVLKPIMESCTKESISVGKSWIFTHTSTSRHYDLMTTYLLRKTTDPKLAYLERLHLIYLVNDLLHHCMRKGANDMQQALETVVIPMFCFAKVLEAGNQENLEKLNKLLTLWETKSNYLTSSALHKLRNFNQTWMDYKNELVSRHSVIVSQIAGNVQQTFEGYQGQHQLFIQHANQSIKQIEQQVAHLQQQQGQLEAQAQLQRQQQLQQQQHIPIMQNHQFSPSPGAQGYSAPGLQIGQSSSPGLQHSGPGYIPPPGVVSSGIDGQIPDLSRPPPGFPASSERDTIPGLPYFDLPAGLMVTMVKLEDDNYKPIDPKAIRIPAPCQPTPRLLQAVEAFYSLPSHERPRDSEGWERLGLYEYFKAKNLARKQKEDDIREGRREKSRSPTPIRRDSGSPNGRSPPRKRYQSKSPPHNRRRRSRSRSPSRRSGRRRRSRSRSLSRRSPTPPLFMNAGLGMDNKIDESNKGHQLLKKMGWGGTGLGANEQGIEAPIQGGELRERKDQYKGVGISLNDPFECYRKTKGQAFVERMRQRAEDRV